MPNLYDSGIRPVIDDYIKKEGEKQREYGDYWSASSAGYCYRKVIFDRLGIPPVNEDARKQRVFSSGDIFHQWIQGITKASGLSIAQELELQDEDLMIRGHIDDLVLIKDDSELKEWRGRDMPYGHPQTPRIKQHLILYDYKTAHSKWFEYAKTKLMSHYHRHQLGTYMYMSRTYKKSEDKEPNIKWNIEKYLNNLEESRRCAISKDDLRLHEQQLLWSDDLRTDVLSYWNGLNEAWGVYSKTSILPPCTCAEYEINSKTGKGFMADPKWNPYYYQGEPCSEVYFRQVLREKEL